MGAHKLTITYDDRTGTVTAVHRCTVQIGDRTVGLSRDLDPDPALAAVLKACVDQNRASLEAEAGCDVPNVVRAGGALTLSRTSRVEHP